MKTHKVSVLSLRNRLGLLGTLALAVAATAVAQVAPPTPRSVAPGYSPPAQEVSSTSQSRYVAPHAGTWDFYLTLGYTFYDNCTIGGNHIWVGRDTYKNGQLKMDFDDSWTFGFGVGYNFTERLSLHAQFGYSSPDMDFDFIADDGTAYRGYGDADIMTADLAIRYDLLTGQLRPYVQGSVGLFYMDTGIINGPGSWWWDGMWGGYYVDTPTVSKSYLALNATAGVRYDFTKHFFADVAYTANFTNTPHDWMINHRVGVSVGWNY